MIASWVLLALLIVLGVMMWQRADLAKMAFRYLRSNPRQSAVAVLGLMVSSATIVGSAIVTDSAANALQESLERLRGDTDLVVDFQDPVENAGFMEQVEATQGIVDASWLSAVEMPVLTEDGFIHIEETVYGIPEDYSDAVRWEAVKGDLAGADLVVTESLADEMDIRVGTTMDLLFPEPQVSPPSWHSRGYSNQTEWTMSRTDVGPDPSDPDIDSEGLNESFDIKVSNQTTGLLVWFSIDFDTAAQFDVEWTDPNGTIRTNASAATESSVGNRFSGQQEWGFKEGYIPAGDYHVVVSSPDAVEATVRLDWHVSEIIGTPPWEYEPPQAVTLTRTVDAIVLDGADPAGDGTSLFVPHGDFQDAAPDRSGVAHIVAVVEDDADVKAIGSQVAGLAQSTGGRDIHDLRSEEEQAVRNLRADMAQLWGFLAGFTVISAVILIFVLMALLTDERRATLATVRAIGAPRSVLIRLQLFEGLGLATLAALVGAVVGVIIAAIMSRALDGLWLVDRLVLRPEAIMDAMSISIMLTLGFALLASWRSSRIEIAPALRDMDAPARGARWRDMVIAGGVAVIGAIVILSTGGSGPIAATLGVPLFMLSAAMVASRWLPKDIVFPAVGLGLVVWMFITRGTLAEVQNEFEALMLPLRALLYTVGGGLLFAYLGHLHRLTGRAFSWMPGGIHLEQSIAQWRTRPGRAAMTIIMLAMMLLGVMFTASLFSVSEREAGSYAGDFEVITQVNEPDFDAIAWLDENPPPAGIDPFEGVLTTAGMDWIPFTLPSEMVNGDGGPVYISSAYAVNRDFVDKQTYTIREGGDPDAFERLLTDPGVVVVDSDLWAGERLTEVGDIINFHEVSEGGNVTASFEVIGVTDGRGFGAMYFHPDGFDKATGQYADRYIGTAMFMTIEEGTEPEQVAARMDAAFHEVGSRSHAVDPEPPGLDAIKAILFLFVFLALAIGAVALGLIAARNVVRRRREIGMVRAIGGTRRQVVTSITLETVLLVFVAVVIAWTGTMILIEGLFSDTSYSIDVGRAVLLSLYTLALSAIAAIIPAYTAARYDPAVAVRNQE